jgi:8-oxo-dGTP pyrophosphatase MutT (NUDIX family)
MESNRTQQCSNCGIVGHVFRTCLAPVTSYGLIAVRYLNNNCTTSLFSNSATIHNGYDSIQFLLIKRKDSIAYVEFLRGRYGQLDEPYICRLLRNMTQSEHERLRTKTFDELWQTLWGERSSIRSHKNDYDASIKKFMHVKDKLPTLLEENPTKWVEPEWGFPKGRRNPYETDMSCAIREFQEETTIKRPDFTVIQNTQSISETFFGSSGVRYCHKYYIAVCKQSVEVQVNKEDYHMAREISGIMWCTLDEATTRIRPDNVEKREILLKAAKILKNFHPVDTYDPSRSYSTYKSNTMV